MACVKFWRGKWCVDFYDTQGKRHVKTLPEGTTKARAKEILREIEEQLSTGVYIPEKKVPTFGEVAKEWLEQKKVNVRDSTWTMYRIHLDLHFEEIKRMKIKNIRISDVERFITIRQKRGMNLGTLRKIIVTFNQVMSYAVRHRYIDYNPVRDAERPRDRGYLTDKKIQFLMPNEIRAFLSEVKNPKYKTLFMLAITSGARQGELLGLMWSDIEWQNNQIHIQRTYNHKAFQKVKTKTSDRKIDIGPAMMLELKKWKLQCPKVQCPRFPEGELVFPTENGNPICQSGMLRRYFFPALKAANVPRIRFHDLRHTFASLLIEQGENIKYIQTQLGHSSPTVTLNIYTHLMKPSNQESARRLENTIFEENGNNLVTSERKGVML